MIPETYAVMSEWDFSRTKKENLDRLRTENYIGAPSAAWLRDVAFVLNRRFEPEGRDRPLVTLAKGRISLDEWRPVLLWHITRDEFLLREFLQDWLFPAFEDGRFRVRPEEVREHLRGIGNRGGITEHEWSESTTNRVAAGLLKTAADFGLLVGTVPKRFATYHLPDRSLLYLLHAMWDALTNPERVIHSPDWRMFLMRPGDLEHELLRLHQFQKLRYEVAGSLIQLSLPCATAAEYAETMVE